MKRFLTLLALVAISICSYAYDFEEGGIYYDITSSTKKTVSVTYKDKNYNSYSGIVMIPSDVTHNGTTYSVTSIGDHAFRDCKELSYVTIPNSVTSIGKYTFYYCSNLTSITIPNSVMSMGEYAFYYCSSLTSVTIGNSVISIGTFAFYYCSSLTSVTIGNSVISIGVGAFTGCSSLTSVTIPSSVTSIRGSAFSSCSSLTSATIPNSVTSIGEYAFSGCSSLTSITIPNSVTNIGRWAFVGCSCLTSIIIPRSVTNIGFGAFSCYNLSSITVEEGNDKYDSRDNCNAIIEISTNSLISGCKNTTIPNSVTSIGDEAFSYCSGLTSVTIPNSVTSISDGAFEYCSDLTSVIIPISVTSIGNKAFLNCTRITSVTIPNSVTSIGDEAFFGCSHLTSVAIPGTVTSIGGNVFIHCSNLTSITNRAKKPQSFYYSTLPKYGTLHILKGYKDVYSNADFWKYYKIVDDLEEVLAKGFIINVDNQHFDTNVKGLRAKATPTNKDADDWNVTWSTTTPSVMIVVPTTGDFMGLTDGVGELVATANDGSGVVATAKVYFGTALFPLVDGMAYNNVIQKTYDNIMYTRTFNETLVGKWSALYVPMSINVENYLEDFDIAEIYAVCPNKDTNGDGEINGYDDNKLIINKKTTGTTLPNTPYLIRPKEAKTYTIASADGILYPAEENSYSCSTMTDVYTFKGLYSTTDVIGEQQYYMTINGILDYSPSEPIAIKPNRWVMSVESHGYGNSSASPKAKAISISVIGEDSDATSIESVNAIRKDNSVYNLNGAKMNGNNLPAGIYIKNGKKIIVK